MIALSPAGRLLQEAGAVHRDQATVAIVPRAGADAVDGVDRRAVVVAGEERAPGLVTEADGGGGGLADAIGAGEAAEVAAEAVLAARLRTHGLEAGEEEAEVAGADGRVGTGASVGITGRGVGIAGRGVGIRRGIVAAAAGQRRTGTPGERSSGGASVEGQAAPGPRQRRGDRAVTSMPSIAFGSEIS
jgi:hypothetical protein